MPPEGSSLYCNADTLIMQTACSVPLVSISELESKKNPQVAFWRPTGEIIVARRKFLVASLYDVNDAAHSMA